MASLVSVSFLAREGVARAQLDLLHQLLRVDHQVAGQLDLVDRVLLAFGHVDGDVDLALVGGDGDLRRLDVEIQIAAIQIPGVQAFKVAGQLLARVFVVAGDETEQVRGRQGKGATQGFVVEHLVADDVDLADARDVPFGDGDVDPHPVSGQVGDFGVDLHAVLAVGVVLALQFLAQLVERRRHEHPAGGQARLAQAFLQVLGLDVLVAGDVQLGNRRPFRHVDDQHVAVPVQLHIAEELGLEQGADDGARPLRVEAVADPQRQGDQHRAGRNALQAVQADVAYREGVRVGCPCGRGQPGQAHGGGQQAAGQKTQGIGKQGVTGQATARSQDRNRSRVMSL